MHEDKCNTLEQAMVKGEKNHFSIMLQINVVKKQISRYPPSGEPTGERRRQRMPPLLSLGQLSTPTWASQLVQWWRIQLPMQETRHRLGGSLIPRLGRSPRIGNGNRLQYSCLENSMDRGAWRATVHGVTESDPAEWLSTADSQASEVCITRNRKHLLYFSVHRRRPRCSTFDPHLVSMKQNRKSSCFTRTYWTHTGCDNEVIPLFVPESQTKSHHHCYTALRTDFKCKMGCCESVSHPVVSDPLWPHGL